MPREFWLTVEGLKFLQDEDVALLIEKRQQSYSEAPLCDLLAILDVERRIGRRNAKLDRLEGITNDIPF